MTGHFGPNDDPERHDQLGARLVHPQLGVPSLAQSLRIEALRAAAVAASNDALDLDDILKVADQFAAWLETGQR